MNRLPILAGVAAGAMLLAQASFAAGCKPPMPGSWGPYGGYGAAAQLHPHYRAMPHQRGSWAGPAYRPGVPHRMMPPGWHGGRMAPPTAGAAAGGAPHAGAGAASAAGSTAIAGATPGDSATVTVSQMRFGPGRVVVKKGATVTWSFEDGMPHTVTAVDGSFDSGRLAGGGRFSHTFDQPGTFVYYCTLHPSMRGEVVVVE
jgi:plastocyanin